MRVISIVKIILMVLAMPTVLLAQDITNLGGTMTSPFQDRNAIQLPSPIVTDDDRRTRQLSGFALFHRFVSKKEGLGPRFNDFSCGGCHVNNGRGRVALSKTSETSTMIVKVSIPGLKSSGAPRDVPGVGEQLRDHSLSGKNSYSLRLEWQTVRGSYPDGVKYLLRKPVLTFKVPHYKQSNLAYSLRMTPPVIGPGLIESIPEDAILALSDPTDSNADGISGRPQYVPDRRSGALALGRFGFKASHPSVEQQTAAASVNDIGVSNPLFPSSGKPVELSEDQLSRIVIYLELAGVPAARSQSDASVVSGKQLFQNVGCNSCHVMTFTTDSAAFPELEGQEIHPFTDLLLHDMGPDLADKRKEYVALGSEWRTTPLWGLGFSETLSTVRARFLHDGRARTIEEAILWHGGEAANSRAAFKNLPAADRAALIAFLKSL